MEAIRAQIHRLKGERKAAEEACAVGNNCDNESTKVKDPQVDLQVVKTDNVDPVSVGDPITYTIEVTNLGPSDATNVTLEDVIGQ